jgi:serine/threonine protein kinase
MSSDSPPENTASHRTPSAVGVPFGRFRLLDKVGSGDVADVYRAVAVGVQGFERRIAIKVMQPEVREEQLGRLFAEEARITALLEHPGVVQVYEYGIIDATPFIAMEYLRGKNLDETLKGLRARGEHLTPSLAVFIAHEVAAALAHAHTLEDDQGQPLGLVHGEVMPANIMLVREGAVKLLDFGVSALARDPRYTVTRRERPLPRHTAYLSPEQVAGQRAEQGSDVFSLGIVLWELLTGRQLFAAGSERRTLANVTGAEIPAPSRLVPGIPPELDRLVLAALARDVDGRYPGAAPLARELEEVADLVPGRHGDLSALLDGLWGSPHDTGKVRTLAGPAAFGPPSRPSVARTLTPSPETDPLADAGRAPTQRLMGDTTLAARPGRTPQPHGGSLRRLLTDPRAVLLGGTGLLGGFIVTAALLARQPAEIMTPPAHPPARSAGLSPVRPATVERLPASSCDSPDAGPPCLAPLAAAPARPRTGESRSHPVSRPTSHHASPSNRHAEPVRRGLEDRRPNPFRE